jgi:16S rRNA (cytosine967-C5)-methyltransferase
LKLHRNLVSAIVDALHAIFYQQFHADRVIEKLLRSNPKWGARDRAFVAESVYDIVRWWRLLWFLLDQVPQPYNLWRVVAMWNLWRGHPLPEWPEFQSIPTDRWQARLSQALEIRKLRESIPDWLDEVGEQELGEQWEPLLASLNQQAAVVLRVNTLKISREVLMSQLAADRIATQAVGDDGLVVLQRQNLFTHSAFQAGWFEIQDAASQQVATKLSVQSSMRVIDACAGSGGKTLHLAALMGGKGQIIALDVEQWKLDKLRQRAKRAGAFNIETRLIVNRKVIKRLHNSADRVLLDVPCSGTGVLKRNPDTKWKLTSVQLTALREQQREILRDYAFMSKIGGQVVYATCSILPSENQQPVHQFLQEYGQFQLVEEKVISPPEGFDGFYLAVLQRLS